MIRRRNQNIALDQFANPAIVVLPEGLGSLFVSVDNHANYGDYTLDWYQGTMHRVR
jgi:hypothetical protein